jgi:probable F420-dependent oxidoreductase
MGELMAPHHGFGMTIPFDKVPLHAQRDRIEELVDLGYTDVWSMEADGTDALTPLALTSVWAPSLRLGTAIVPAYTRGPALLAQSAGTMAQAAPGRFVLGLGASSNIIVERWNGLAFTEPYKRVRDTVRFLRAAFTGEKVAEEYDTFSINGFRLGPGAVPEQPVPILVAALREGMLNLAGREGDGAIVNWLSAEDVATVAPIVKAHGADKEIVARLFVAPSEDTETVRAQARYAVAAYVNVPVYAAFHEWLGRGPRLAPVWEAWKAGDRPAALAAIPDEVVDELIIHGSYDECRAHIQRYRDNGVTTASLTIMPLADVDVREAVRRLAPNA